MLELYKGPNSAKKGFKVLHGEKKNDGLYRIRITNLEKQTELNQIPSTALDVFWINTRKSSEISNSTKILLQILECLNN